MRKALIGILLAATMATPVAASAQQVTERYQRIGERNQARVDRQQARQERRETRAVQAPQSAETRQQRAATRAERQQQRAVQTQQQAAHYSPYRGHSYSRFSIGFALQPLFYSQRYWINDPWQYRLPPAEYGTRWVRYYDDVLLVDTYTGEVIDVIYDFFW